MGLTAKNIRLGLIGATTALFTLLFFGAAQYSIALAALASGLIWLVLEIRWQQSIATIFFLVFFALGIAGSFNHLPTPIVLLCLSTNLAAWDLSRLESRIANGAEGEVKVTLSAKHLQKLAITAVAGFIVALLATSVQISINFVALAIIILVVMIALRTSMVYARNTNNHNS
jgi:hypothetical protein